MEPHLAISWAQGSIIFAAWVLLERLAENGAVTKSPVTTIRSGFNPLTRSTAFAMGTTEKCGS